jgi:CubicO group peptidase (beta-lactamase class C family)
MTRRARTGLAVALATLTGVLAWTVLVIAAAFYGWGHRSLAPPGDTSAFVNTAKQLIDSRNHGNTAFRLIEHGMPRDEYFVSIGDPVGPATLFQVASLSKWVTAWGVMTLVESGKVDLDAPASRYLTRWKLPQSEFDNDGVTVRRLLSHTAGLTDGLGFAGYVPGVELPSLEATLAHPDASEGHSGVIRVGAEPGSGWEYSGGGYLILQLLIEEVAGEPFEDYMRRAILRPLGMERSTFTVDASTPDVATFYDVDGTAAIHYRFTAKAAASLYTSVADLTRFVQAHFAGSADEPVGRGVLAPETVELMRQPQAALFGADIWGLGVMLFAPTGDEFVIGHDGSNTPAINTAVRLNPVTGDGIVVLETGDPLLASTLASEWTFWQTGTPDLIMLTMQARSIATMIGAGSVVIVLAGLLFGWRVTRRVID